MKRRTGSMTLPRAWRLGWVVVLALLAQTTHAVCVQTSQQLSDALSNVDFFNPLTVQIVQGTYTLSGNGQAPANTSLLGGYTPNCVSRQIASGNTVITASPGQGMNFLLYGNLTVEGLTFNEPLGLSASYNFPSFAQILITRSVFTGVTAGEPLSIFWFLSDEGDAGGVRIVDSLFAGNTTNGPCVIDFYVEQGLATINMTSDTIVNNPNTTQGGVCLYVTPGSITTAILSAFDSIFYDNGASDLYSNIPRLELVDNIIGTRNSPPPNILNVGTLSVDPKLNANYHPIEAPPSPAINSGEYDNGNLPPTDLDGGPRIIGSRVDRGAYESSIDDAFLLSVTNANGAGAGSLRAAILSANADTTNTAHIINFAIGSGCGPHVITLGTPLPTIKSSMLINGYSQTGAAENDFDVGDDAIICIVLDGATNNIADGLLVPASAAADTQLQVHGLGMSGFSHGAVTLYGGSAHSVLGNRIGGAVGGVALSPSGTGVIVGSGVSNTYVGGTDPADRNIVGDAIGDGIVISGASGGSVAAHDNQILNNLVGVGWSVPGTDYINRGNGVKGIHVAGYGNTISGNVVGYNGNDGIDLDGSGASGNTVDHNQIGGTDLHLQGYLTNASMGVRVENGAGANTIRYNQISNNGGTGVRIVSGQGNSIRKNSIYLNGSYGIDLATGGVTPNDDDGALQVVDYANRGQNFPVLTLAIGTAYGGSVTGTLTTLPGDYTVDFYMSYFGCDASGYGEGQTWLRSATVTVPSIIMIGDQGTVSFTRSFTLPPPSFIGDGTAITATATDELGNTSEFSACIAYINDVIFADGFQ